MTGFRIVSLKKLIKSIGENSVKEILSDATKRNKPTRKEVRR